MISITVIRSKTLSKTRIPLLVILAGRVTTCFFPDEPLSFPPSNVCHFASQRNQSTMTTNTTIKRSNRIRGTGSAICLTVKYFLDSIFMQATTSRAGETCGRGERSVDGTARNTRQKNEGNTAGSWTGRFVRRHKRDTLIHRLTVEAI